jgi:hypothetical protein
MMPELQVSDFVLKGIDRKGAGLVKKRDRKSIRRDQRQAEKSQGNAGALRAARR